MVLPQPAGQDTFGTTQLGALCKHDEGELDPIVCDSEDIKHYPSQYRPLKDTPHHQSPSGH